MSSPGVSVGHLRRRIESFHLSALEAGIMVVHMSPLPGEALIFRTLKTFRVNVVLLFISSKPQQTTNHLFLGDPYWDLMKNNS